MPEDRIVAGEPNFGDGEFQGNPAAERDRTRMSDRGSPRASDGLMADRGLASEDAHYLGVDTDFETQGRLRQLDSHRDYLGARIDLWADSHRPGILVDIGLSGKLQVGLVPYPLLGVGFAGGGEGRIGYASGGMLVYETTTTKGVGIG